MAMPALSRMKLPPGLGKAFWFAAALLLAAECALHSEAVMYRYRSVFAVGRAIDKLHYLEAHPPHLLFLGNSRTDNGIDPHALAPILGQPASFSFNLGMPGANLLTFYGVVVRLDAKGLLGENGIRDVVLGLDENSLQEDNSLGYVDFLADRFSLWQTGRYRDWFGSWLRLWSYSSNLRELRELEKALRFAEASLHSVDPVGGAAAHHLGYRAGFGAAQNAIQVAIQETAAQRPPAPGVEAFLWRLVDMLQARGVRVFVVVPPLRDRQSAFFDAHPAAAPYRALLARLRARGVAVLAAPKGYTPDEFINSGHLDDRGAQRFSAELGRQLVALGVH